MSLARRRLLIINPNTNADVTRWLADEARRLVGSTCDVVAINADSGLAAIETPNDLRLAARAVALTVQMFADADGAIVGAFGDPGLETTRALGLMPVVGLGETGIAAAARSGQRFSIVTLGEAMRGSIIAKVRAMGRKGQVAGVHILPFSIANFVADRRGRFAAIAAAVCACEEGVVLLGGAPFAGLAAELARETGRDVLDGVEACLEALGLAEGSDRPRAMPGRK
jgi:allantoin racemase